MRRAIWCPGANKGRGAWVPLGAYVRAVKTAIRHPDTVFACGITSEWSTTGEEIRRQFWRGVQDRINQGIPYSRRGVEAQD